jgi:hypothetical protein
MAAKVILNDRETTLRLFVGVGTIFLPNDGALVSRDFFVLAETQQMAAAYLAMQFPNWELQCLTCLSDAPWLKTIVLDESCPQAEALFSFIIKGVSCR